MSSSIVKSLTGTLYEVQYLVHPSISAPSDTTDVYACYRLSAYDGMPIGRLVWVAESELEPQDRERLHGRVNRKLN